MMYRGMPFTTQRACLLGPFDPLFWIIVIPLGIGMWAIATWLLIVYAAVCLFFRQLGNILAFTFFAGLILWIVL